MSLKRKLKIVLSVLACMLCVVIFHHNSVDAAELKTMRLDGISYHGTTEQSAVYQLSPRKSSMVKVRLIYGSTEPVKATLKNLSTNVEKIIESTIQNQKSTIEFTYFAEATNYQLTLEFTNGSRDFKYVLVGKLLELESGEGTRGNSLDEAIKLSVTDQMIGVAGFGDLQDCYKLSLNSELTLKFNFKNHGKESLNIKVYDTYKNLIRVETVGSTLLSSEFEIPKANGNYYVVVEQVYTNGLGTNYTLTVGDFVAVTNLTFTRKTLTLTEGSIKTMKVAVTPSDATERYSYKTSNKKVATVNSYGKITAVKAGTTTITAYSISGRVKATLKLIVEEKPVTKVSLNTTKKTLEVGNTFQLKPTAYPRTTATSFTYSSSDAGIAKVDRVGKITAVKKGSCIITVTAKNKTSATCAVTVTKKVSSTVTPKPTKPPTIEVTSIKADSNLLMLKVGESHKITYSIVPSNASDQTVVFTCHNEKIVTVDKEGVLTAVAAGTTIVNATSSNGASMFVTVIVY